MQISLEGKSLLSVTGIIGQIPLKPVALIPWLSTFGNQIPESCYCKLCLYAWRKQSFVAGLTD